MPAPGERFRQVLSHLPISLITGGQCSSVRLQCPDLLSSAQGYSTQSVTPWRQSLSLAMCLSRGDEHPCSIVLLGSACSLAVLRHLSLCLPRLPPAVPLFPPAILASFAAGQQAASCQPLLPSCHQLCVFSSSDGVQPVDAAQGAGGSGAHGSSVHCHCLFWPGYLHCCKLMARQR